MRESEAYLDAEDWEAMYTILWKGLSEGVDRLKPLPGNREVCRILVQALLDAEEYRRTVLGAIQGEDEERIRKRRQALRLPGEDGDSPLTDR